MARRTTTSPAAPRSGALRGTAGCLLLAVSLTGHEVAAAGDELARPCVGCHGPQGVSETAGVPSLAGQNAPYLREQLAALRSARRPSAVPGHVPEELGDAELNRIADHFAALPYLRLPQAVDAEKAERGRETYRRLCQLCHPNDGKEAPYAEYPLLAGQDLPYLRQAMNEILAGKRQVGSFMLEMVELAPSDRLDDAIHFFAGQNVDPSEVQGARLDSPSPPRRRFRPAR